MKGIRKLGRSKYKISVWHRSATGRRRRFERTVLGSRKEAEAVLAEVRNSIRLNGIAPKTTPDVSESVEEYLRSWFDEWVTTNNKPSEIDSKRSTIKNHLVPEFGDLALTEVTAEQVEAFKTKQLGKHKPATVRLHLACLRKALACAVDWGRLDRNPMAAVKFPSAEGREVYLEPDEVQAFVYAVPERWQPFFEVAIQTGLRKGELLALRWCDVDLHRGEIRVRHTLYQGKRQSPKTKASIRTLPMTPRVWEILGSQRPVEGGGRRYVFEGRDGLPLGASAPRRALEVANRGSGLDKRLRFHDLRHVFASLCVMGGMSLPTLQGLLGHSTIKMVLRYAHVSDGHKRTEMDRVWGPHCNENATFLPPGDPEGLRS